MRTIAAFLPLLALAHGAADKETTGKCLLYSSDAVSDAIDAAMFMWASADRCGKVGEDVKCAVGVLSSVESMNKMVNVILRTMEMCGELDGIDYKCGLAASTLSKASSGVGASSANVAAHCQTPSAALAATNNNGGISNWGHQDSAQCVLDVKDSLENLFKATRAIMEIDPKCAEGKKHCAATGLRMAAALSGMGAYLAGAVGHCSKPNTVKGSVCAQASLQLVEDLEEIGQAGIQVAEHCGSSSSRLYSMTNAVAQPKAASPTNLILAAFIPVAAVVSFVGGRYMARTEHVQVREFSSDTEGLE